jgi:hypothetical protein
VGRRKEEDQRPHDPVTVRFSPPFLFFSLSLCNVASACLPILSVAAVLLVELVEEAR